jgi:hypothetical protein
MADHSHQGGIHLLKAKPWLPLLVPRRACYTAAVVLGVGDGVLELTNYQDVQGQTEGIREDRHRAQVDNGVCRRVPSQGAVEVPLGQSPA